MEVEKKISAYRVEADKLAIRSQRIQRGLRLGTIDVVVDSTPPARVAPPPKPPLFAPFRKALSHVFENMISSGANLIELASTLFPLGLFSFPIGYVGLVLWRRRRRRLQVAEGRGR